MLPESHNHSLFFSDNRSIIALEQKRKSYIGINSNKKKFFCYIPDKMYSNKEEACDYLLLNQNDKLAYFIELKGSDVLKAVDQISNSLDLYFKHINGFEINARIVSRSNVTDLKYSKFTELNERIKKLGGTLKKQNNKLEENI